VLGQGSVFSLRLTCSYCLGPVLAQRGKPNFGPALLSVGWGTQVQENQFMINGQYGNLIRGKRDTSMLHVYLQLW